MPIAATTPTVPAVPADTLRGHKCILAILPEGGSQMNFRGRIGSIPAPQITKVDRKVPDDNGILIKDRSDVTEITRTVRITTDELLADNFITLFNAGSTSGTARLWILDKNDEAGTVALMSNEFDTTVTVEGDIAADPESFAEAEIVCEVLGDFTLDNKADASS